MKNILSSKVNIKKMEILIFLHVLINGTITEIDIFQMRENKILNK